MFYLGTKRECCFISRQELIIKQHSLPFVPIFMANNLVHMLVQLYRLFTEEPNACYT